MSPVDGPLCGECLEHLGLMGVRSHLQARKGDGHPIALAMMTGLGEGVVEPIPVEFGVVGLEGAVVPVGIERGGELRHQRRGRDPGESDVPLHAVQQGSVREVRGADVGGVEASTAAKQPRLCV